jgi:hypothetical protein
MTRTHRFFEHGTSTCGTGVSRANEPPMKTASQLLFTVAGKPSRVCVDRPEFLCWICGAPWTRGVPRDDWAGAQFTGQNRVRCVESGLVCEPCVWAMAGKPPDTLRMTSHLFDGRGWLLPNKGAKPLQRSWLRGAKSGPWFAAIADSGKKHVVPWTPVNPEGLRAGTGQVLFEERLVTLGDWTLVDDLSSLLTAGASKETIETGEYHAGAWSLCAEEIEAFEARWSSERASDWWALAVWLAQRDEDAVQARMAREKEERDARKRTEKETARSHRGDAARDASRVPRNRSKRAEALGPTAGPAPGERQDVLDGGGVVDADVPKPPARGAQCELF